MLWVTFGKQKMKPKKPLPFNVWKTNPSCLSEPEDFKSTEYSISSAAQVTFLPVEGKFLLFFGHKSATAHVRKIWLTEK